MPRQKLLHVGCGHPEAGKLPPAFRGADWSEVRLDIDPDVGPDIVASITDLAGLPAGGFDALFSSHNLEHLEAHEVPLALAGFRRLLAPDGLALLTMPDLQAVAALVAEGALEEAAYISPAGPIAPLDMIYGHRGAITAGHRFMAHRTGFTARSLSAALFTAGFAAVSIQREPRIMALWAIAFASAPTDERLRTAQSALFPLKVPPALWPAASLRQEPGEIASSAAS